MQVGSSDQADTSSVYYQHTKRVPLASRVSHRIRAKMFRLFLEEVKPNEEMRVLDVGVTSDSTQPESNYFERMYPYPARITCVGIEDGSYLMDAYPGLRYRRVTSGERLPFVNGEFDVAFSNAVIEHVGSRSEQAFFLSEIVRVSKRFFVTTPNRWFPFEHHTGLPLLHWLPAKMFRGLIRGTKYAYWSEESNLNILTASELKGLLPSNVQATVRVVRFCGVGANLIATGQRL